MMNRFLTPVLVVIFLVTACGAGSTNSVPPSVTTDAPSFIIQGEVSKPGTYAWTEGMTLARAIAAAGGITRRAESRVFVLRDKGGFPPEMKVYNHPFNNLPGT